MGNEASGGTEMDQVVGFIASSLILASTLWVAMKITSVRCSWPHLYIAAVVASLVGLIPVTLFGALLPVVVLVFLISRMTSAEVWPDAVLMVIISWGLTWVLSMFVIGRILSGQ